MSEKPILFSGAMVRALLRDENPKTQTRRVVSKPDVDSILWFAGSADENEPAKAEYLGQDIHEEQLHVWCAEYPDEGSIALSTPYGVPGDRLWVKETFVAFGQWETRFNAKKARNEWHFVDLTAEAGFAYRFEGADPSARRRAGAAPTWHTRPSIFMPRAASRITREVSDVRVERLQDISYEDALAEGISDYAASLTNDPHPRGETPGQMARRLQWPQRQYHLLWDSLNAARGYGWDVNPWVWVVEFRMIQP
jgi:hypothetical protein